MLTNMPDCLFLQIIFLKCAFCRGSVLEGHKHILQVLLYPIRYYVGTTITKLAFISPA